MIAKVGETVARRREALGLNRSALAMRADVSPLHLEQLEAGQLGVTTVELERLAGVLELDYPALLRGVEVERAEPSIFLRHHANADFADVDMPILDEALSQGRALRYLWQLLGRARGVEDLPKSEAGPNPARHGYALARELRKRLGLGGEPLGDACAFAEEVFQIAVLVRPLSSVRVTALSMAVDDGASIVLNDVDPDRRKNGSLARVHIAHELCHILFDSSKGGLHLVVDVALDKKDLAQEQRARGFAAELLLPEEGLKALLGQPTSTSSRAAARKMIDDARRTFRTPNEIATNHLVNLRFVDPLLRESLLGTPTSLGPIETRLPPVDGPSVLVRRLVEEAHTAGLVTDGQVRSLLRLDLSAPVPWDAESP